MEINEGRIKFGDFSTYFRTVNPYGKKLPVIFLHGGPGSTHNYFESFDELAFKTDRPFVMYDQIGCGESYTEGDRTIFNGRFWAEELINLREKLGLDKAHILGQSWGGMLALLYEVNYKPHGISSYILSSTLPSAHLWKEEQMRRIDRMPSGMKKDIYRAVEKEDFSDPGYLKAVDYFMDRYCGPDINENSAAYLKRPKISGTEAYLTGWGPNEFTPTGTLKDYEVTGELGNIKVPCLVMSGQEDLSSPYISKTMADNIPTSQWHLFRKSRHMPFIEEMDEYHRVLTEWLDNND